MGGGMYGGDMSHLHRQGTTVAQMEEEGHALAASVASAVDTVEADKSDSRGAGITFMGAVEDYRDQVLRKGNRLANAIGRLGTNVAEGANTTQQTQNETTSLQNGSGNPVNGVTQASAPITSGGGGGGGPTIQGATASFQPAQQPQYEAELVPVGEARYESEIMPLDDTAFESSIEAAPWTEGPLDAQIEPLGQAEWVDSTEGASWVEAPVDREEVGWAEPISWSEGAPVAEPAPFEPGLPVAEPAPFEPGLPVAEPAPFEPGLPVAEPAPFEPGSPVAEPAPFDDTTSDLVGSSTEPDAGHGNGEGEGWAPHDQPVATGQSAGSVDYIMDADGTWVKHPTLA